MKDKIARSVALVALGAVLRLQANEFDVNQTPQAIVYLVLFVLGLAVGIIGIVGIFRNLGDL